MGLYCAVDLHGNNGFYGIVDETGKRVFKTADTELTAVSIDGVGAVQGTTRSRGGRGIYVQLVLVGGRATGQRIWRTAGKSSGNAAVQWTEEYR